ncbi:glycoside hydrolase family 20 zincin-like fold domain-containing protein [Acidobacteria bacterium AH-259-O06]|nr:glycoside hydrolase family 20 zincin-like fold domain-containing protein [Acidobacteria bacterium AH-259-G07]MDA2930367.1 glycoside hydrolase family 20 zincin-like fold domain-containing protein [Acidobacteria bacterium AH-259-O06]
MKSVALLSSIVLGVQLFVSPVAAKNLRIIPYPHFQSWGKQVIQFDGGANSGSLFLVDRASPKEILAAELIKVESTQRSGEKAIFQNVPLAKIASKTSPGIYLVNWTQDSDLKNRTADILDEGDRQVLSDPQKTDQAYVIRMLPDRREIWLVGAAPQGVLYAAATLLQVMGPASNGVGIQEVHIRDYPDFRYRAASDWLLNAEINRWAYDWGDGKRAFMRRIKRKLDFCLRYKINLVVFDGFGWNSEKFPGYAQMMRELNGYARERGIKLLFGGYGANYQPALIRPEHNVGRVWYNREEYPHGEIYSCFGEANLTYREESPLGGSLGTCRGNHELNQLKAAEMEEFVRSVEPGALYIHHEDVGNLLRMGDTGGEANRLREWESRCYRCRAKWPNNDFLARDGGAGAIAHGYRNLINAIFSVKNLDSGYHASKHCTVILISPGYSPQPTDRRSWENHLIFWSNVVSLLPQHENLQIGFREVFPQQGTGKRWIDAYKERLGSLGLNTRTFFFFLGGADLYSRSSFNYPFSATAAMNGLFLGAESIYNFSGAVFQEPLQLLNSEFSWNVAGPGHRIPQRYEAVKASWQALMTNEQVPAEIVGPDGLLEEACRKLYGENAGLLMMRYFNLYKTQPRVKAHSAVGPEDHLLVPIMPKRLYPLPVLWRILELDRDVGGLRPDRRTQELLTLLKVTPSEWQRRWVKLWQLYAEVNDEAVGLITELLQTPDLREDARPDIQYLKKCLQVGGRFSQVLASHHEVLAHSEESDSDAQALVAQTQDELQSLSTFLQGNFSFDTVGPLGGDQASWLKELMFLRNRLQKFLQGE